MTSYTLNIRREVQRDTLLCWAAVSVMAIRSFPRSKRFRHATQEDVVAYERAGMDALLPKGSKEPEELKRARRAFRSGLANATNSPLLLGLDRTVVEEIAGNQPRMLSKAHFLEEIATRKRPILIRWVYGSINQPAGTRSGAHELIVTGYNSKTHEVRIWDPWPAANMRDPAPQKRERWIPYARYVDPVSDGGVKVRADHEFDEFALRRRGAPIDLGAYPKLAKIPKRRSGDDSEPDLDLEPGGFKLDTPIRKHMKTHKVLQRNGKRMPGPFTTAAPIPILPISVKQLGRYEKEPAKLVGMRCGTVVIPILKHRRVVDSFLLTRRNGRWREGAIRTTRSPTA